MTLNTCKGFLFALQSLQRPPVALTIKITDFVFVNSQCDGARLQVKGLGVPQLHVQTLRGSNSARHHPHIHEGREGLTCSNGETGWRRKQTFTETGSGLGAPLVLKAAASASQSKFNPHHNLNIRSHQPPQECQELGNEGVLPHYLGCLYHVHVPSLAIALRPAH